MIGIYGWRGGGVAACVESAAGAQAEPSMDARERTLPHTLLSAHTAPATLRHRPLSCGTQCGARAAVLPRYGCTARPDNKHQVGAGGILVHHGNEVSTHCREKAKSLVIRIYMFPENRCRARQCYSIWY